MIYSVVPLARARALLIGLLADTHIPEAEKILPFELMEALRGVDLILHAGDIFVPSVLDDLERIAPVLAARGDDEYGDMLTDKRVKDKHILKLEGQTLWLVHKRPYSFTLGWQKEMASEQDKSDSPSIVVFGHEHRAVVQLLDDTLFINPGSPTFQNYCRGLGTIAILDIDSGEADVRIVQLGSNNG